MLMETAEAVSTAKPNADAGESDNKRGTVHVE